VPGILIYLGGVTGLVLLAAVTLSHRKAVFWLAFVAPFVPIAYLDRYHFRLPVGFKWLPFVAVVFAAIASMAVFPAAKVSIPRSVLLAYGGLLVVSALSLLLNDTPLASFLVAQRGYAVLFAAIIALKSAYAIYDKDRLYSFLVYAGIGSAVICFLQRIFVVPYVGGLDPGDRVTGLFSVGSITLFFHLFCIGIVLAYWLEGRRVVRWSPRAVLPVFVLGIAVGNQKAALPYLLALLAFVFLTTGTRARLRARIQLLVATAVLPLLAFYVFTIIYDRSYQRSEDTSYSRSIFDREYLSRYLFGDEDVQLTRSGSLPRGRAVLFAHELIATSARHYLLGMGPGATSESRVAGASGSLTRRYPGYSIDRVALGMILADTGVLGVALQVAFLMAIFLWRPPPSVEDRVHGRIRRILVFLSLLYFVYSNMYYEPIYGLLVAVVLYPIGSGNRPAGLQAGPVWSRA
jgi:hypothetical protein